jgi:hypothetical protein
MALQVVREPGSPAPSPGQALFATGAPREIVRADSPRAKARAIYLRRIEEVTRSPQLEERGFWFPVAPQQYTVSAAGLWNEVQLVGAGLAAHPIGPPLREVTFSSFFPSDTLRSTGQLVRLCQGLRNFEDYNPPDFACRVIETLRDNNDIFWLVTGTDVASYAFKVVGQSPSNILKMPARITNFSWSEAAGRPGDRLFDITLSEYEPQAIRRRGGTRLTPLPKTYQPKPGEDLRDVAIRFYGDPKKWTAIATHNKIKGPAIPKDPKTKKPKVIKLPADSKIKPAPPTGRTPPNIVRPRPPVQRPAHR